ncbi:MAG: HisA/HisF-related TIM barrel protein [Gemmataceae bacterium]|nr:HisA/HisF-related TIM barrel protein [Gemmataceae bacterium]MDW8265055.1 HisA/HisF-related TIM barrel protein [Gemmataceae bacterium]
MLVLPVLDLKSGLVVHGRGGRRHEYRPIVTPLSATAQPVDVARGFDRHFGLREMYVADLDAIAGAVPAWKTFAALQEAGFVLWVDAGVRAPPQARALFERGVEYVILGLETLAGPDVLRAVVAELGADRLVFSLDLRHGEPLGDRAAWKGADALGIADQATAAGIGRMIVLDLARVGLGAGPGTEELCRLLHERHPELMLVAGGGVRHAKDLRRLAKAGVRGALVASALHERRLVAADWQSR